MNISFSLFCNQKRQIIALGAIIFVIFALFLTAVPGVVQAQIYQFSPGDKNYTAAVYIAAAQEANEKVDVEKKVTLDEDIAPEDFGLKGAGLLPTSPFYFLKNLRRSITSFLTFNDVKEAELKLQFASEKLLETKALVEKGDVDELVIRSALDNFRKELERVKSQAERASQKAEGEEAERLARKLMDSVLKYQKFLGRIEKELSPDALEEVVKTKETASEAFSKVFNLAEPEKVGEELVQIIDEQKGSDFKHFKNIEVLKEVEEKVPEEAKDAIRIAQENALNRLQQELEKFEEAKRAIFEDFVREIGGSEARHLEILSELELRPVSEDVRAAILAAKEEVVGKTEKRLETLPPSAKELLLAPLAKGDFEDLRLVQELENTLASDVALGVVSAIKQKSIAEFGEKVKRIDEDERAREELFKNVERFHDVKSLAVLNEIEKLVPEDKKETFRSLKIKAIEEIKNDIENARDESQKEMIVDALAGDHPNYFKALENIKSDIPSDIDRNMIAESIKRALFEVIQERVNVIRDKERLALFEREFEQNRQYIGGKPRGVNLDEFFKERRVAFEDPERVKNAIKRAEEAINELRAIVNSLPFEQAAPEGQIDPALRHIEELFTLSQKKLERARFYFDGQDFGRAFGMAESAFSLAESGARFAEDYKAGYRKSIVEEEKSPFSDFFIPPSSKGRTASQEFRIFNQYEFQQFCIFAKGFLKQSLVCAFPDGRVLKADQSGFPLVVPPEFLPEHFRPSIQPEETSSVCPPLPKTPPSVCPDGQYREIIRDERGCETFGECRVPDERLSCNAFWQGYVFDSKTKSCFLKSDTGCTDPFIYHTKEECEKAAGAVSQAICPALPTVASCPAGQEKFVVFSSPECGIYYGCRPQKTEKIEGVCGNNVCESSEDQYSCSVDCGLASDRCNGGVGNGVCEAGEDYWNCYVDCPQ